MFDRGGKVIAAIVGMGSIGGGIVAICVTLGDGRWARASSMPQVETRLTTLEQQRVDEVEWRRYLAEQVGQIAMRVGAPALAPPVIALTPAKK